MREDSATRVLGLFAKYGFRKASMSDIAEAADLSRQSIYNQFGSKEDVLEWAVTTFLDDIAGAAVEILRQSAGAPTDVIIRAFMAWTGDHLPLLRDTPHGAEILDRAISAAARADRDFEGEFAAALIEFLLASHLASTQNKARDAAFVLGLASKGLLLKCRTRDEYVTGMERVTKFLFH